MRLQSHFDPIGIISEEYWRKISNDIKLSLSDFEKNGFTSEDLPDLYYYFNRIPNWLGNARQVQGFTGTNVMPLGVPPLINLAFMATAQERAQERIHHHLISTLCPELLEVPFALQRWHPALGVPDRGAVGMPSRTMPVHGSWQYSLNDRPDIRNAIALYVANVESNIWKAVSRDKLLNHLRSEKSNMLQLISILGLLPMLYFDSQGFKASKILTNGSDIEPNEWHPIPKRSKLIRRLTNSINIGRTDLGYVSKTSSEKLKTMKRLPPEAPGGIRNLQVGCGPRHIRPDWWNTDLRLFPGIDEALDATKPWRWTDRLEHIYAEHFLEHLPLEGAVHFLVNAGQALRVGGHIRLSTPGLEWVMCSHFRFVDPKSPGHVMDTLQTNRAFHGWGHKFIYSRGMLQWLLGEMGYTNIRFLEYGESEIQIFKGIELHGNYTSSNGYPSVWIVEATRGVDPIELPAAANAVLETNFLQQVARGR